MLLLGQFAQEIVRPTNCFRVLRLLSEVFNTIGSATFGATLNLVTRVELL